MFSTIALVSQKGGSGKTTLAVALAVAHELAAGEAVVIDLDPQGSAGVWGDLRGDDLPPVVPAHPPRLARVLDTARNAGASLAIIDMAPREAGGAVEAARVADLVLVPCRPSAVDLAAIPASLDVSRLAGTTAAVVLNAVPARGDSGRASRRGRRRVRRDIGPGNAWGEGGARPGVHRGPDGSGNRTPICSSSGNQGPLPMGSQRRD